MTGVPRRAVVICASTRAATGVYPDRTGPLIVAALREWGFDVDDATVVPDGGGRLRPLLRYPGPPPCSVAAGARGLDAWAAAVGVLPPALVGP